MARRKGNRKPLARAAAPADADGGSPGASRPGGSHRLASWRSPVTLAMTRQERESFLSDVHVGVLSIPEEGRGPLTVPVWYTYEAGELRFVTARTSRKGRLLERAGRISLCVQTETSPYKYVSIEGPIIAIEPADRERDRRPLARRYLGADAGDAYIEETRDEHAANVLVRVRPERWLTVDYAKE